LWIIAVSVGSNSWADGCVGSLTMGDYEGTPYRIHEKAYDDLDNVFPDFGPNDLVLGFTPPDHTYFSVQIGRYSGSLGKEIGTDRIRLGEKRVSPGIVIRVRNVPDRVMQTINYKLREGIVPKRSVTCSRGVCKSLNYSGMAFPRLQSYSPYFLLRWILKN